VVDTIKKQKPELSEDELLREKQRDLIRSQGMQVKRNSLIKSQAELREGRYFHGILTFVSRPLGKSITMSFNFYRTSLFYIGFKKGNSIYLPVIESKGADQLATDLSMFDVNAN
jgi:hypothetical protein